MNTIVVDIDNTITIHSDCDYDEMPVNLEVVEKIKQAKKEGFEVILYTSRNMRTYNKDISKINKYTLPKLIEWLEKNDVPFDGIIAGKPWCGKDGFYVDDRAIRPNEFTELSFEEIRTLLKDG